MATLGIVMGGQTEGALDQQQIGVADTLLDRGRRTGITGIGEARAVGRVDDHAPCRDVVATLDDAHTELADLERAVGLVLASVERGVEEPVALADGLRQRVEPRTATGWQMDRQWIRGRFAPWEQVTQTDDVEIVVGVHVADDDRRQVVRVHEPFWRARMTP